MKKRILPICFAMLMLLAAVSIAQSPAKPDADGRGADRALIRAHIESICQAFLDGDIDKIFATHTTDWRGFLENSLVPIKGIDEYMRANNIPWPLPAGAAKSRQASNDKIGFKVFDFDVHFYGPDMAVACFMVDFGEKEGTGIHTYSRLRIMDIYARRSGKWIQAASHTVSDPTWRAQQMALPGNLSAESKQQLLSAREAVWRAYFTNDQSQLEKLVPAETVTLDGSKDSPFVRKTEILESARQGAQAGNKLIRIEFPKTEIQLYGSTAIIYTTYLYEIEDRQGKRNVNQGRATEVFVRRNGSWVNPGWHLTPDQ